MKKQNLIFVDIDGVLNNIIDGSNYYSCQYEKYGLSKSNIENLIHILNNVDAKIMIISSWRNRSINSDKSYLKNPMISLLKHISSYLYDFNFGKCPHIKNMSKKNDILGFFYNLQYETELKMSDFEFVILDDSTNQELDFFEDHFFRISRESGLTKENADSVIKYFKEKNKNE